MSVFITERTVDPLSSAPAYVPRVAFRGRLTNTTAVLYTAPTLTGNPTPGSVTSYLKSIIVCNTDSSARTYTFTVVESGGSVADNRAIFLAVTIAANTTHVHKYGDDEFPLAEGETVNGLASVTNVVTIRIAVEDLTH